MSNVRVGIDAWGLSGDAAYSGMGQYAMSLLKWVPRLAPFDVVAYGAPGEVRPPWLPDDVRWRTPDRAPSGRLTAISSRTWWLPRATSEDRLDLFHAPGLHVRPSSPPVPSVRCPLVVTIHDVIPLSFYGSALPKRNRWFYRWNLGRAMKARRVLTVSRSARDEIARYADRSARSIEVVASAVEFTPNPDRTSVATTGIMGDYLLYAGSYEPRKGLLDMLSAFDRFCRTNAALSLLAITERASGHADQVRAALASLPCRDRVRLVHSVPDTVLRALYTHATAVVFPSLAEGLGLPAIQAAACGVPLVVSDLPALRETVGNVAVFARPGDPESLFRALTHATCDESVRVRAATLGPGTASWYSTERCTADHAKIYWSCLERRHASV